MKIYISGPITYSTGPDQFGPLKARLEAMGYETLNPKDVPPCPDKSCTRLPHEIEKGWEHSWACFLKHDLIAMMKYCDTIVMMDGWQDSHGARLELTTAAALGFNVLFARDLSSLNKREPEASVADGRPLVHETSVARHGIHWDVTCFEPRCSWGAVNVPDRHRAEEIADEHEAWG